MGGPYSHGPKSVGVIGFGPRSGPIQISLGLDVGTRLAWNRLTAPSALDGQGRKLGGAGASPAKFCLNAGANILDVPRERGLQPSKHEGVEGGCSIVLRELCVTQCVEILAPCVFLLEYLELKL